MVVDVIVVVLAAAVLAADAATIAAAIITAAIIAVVVETADVDAAITAIAADAVTSVQAPGARHTAKASATDTGRALMMPAGAGQAAFLSPGLRKQNPMAAAAEIKLTTCIFLLYSVYMLTNRRDQP